MVLKSTKHRGRAAAKNTLALILAGGNGTRLGGLTASRPKPAVHVAGKFRCIDFALSNCLNSGIRRIAVLTQYKAQVLEDYLRTSWQFLHSQCGEFVNTWAGDAASQGQAYQGTADAVRKNCDRIRQLSPSYVVILAADHVYKMDYREMLSSHVSRQADVTIGTVEVPEDDARRLGVVTVDDDERVVRFDEKPTKPSPLHDKPGRVLASMGIYIFNTDVLLDCLTDNDGELAMAHDFGADLIPVLLHRYRLLAHRFSDSKGRPGYWRDIGTLDALWGANMGAVDCASDLSLHDAHWPVRTHEPVYPPALSCTSANGIPGRVTDTLLSSGCVVSGATVERSVLSCDVHVDEGSLVQASVVLPHVRIGTGCRIRHAIIDEHCVIPDGFCVGDNHDVDETRFEVSDGGIVLVTAERLQQVINASSAERVNGRSGAATSPTESALHPIPGECGIVDASVR